MGRIRTMQTDIAYSARKLVEYDALSRRLWILGQRCHHGATGSLVAAAACLALMTDPPSVTKPHLWPGSLLALAASSAARERLRAFGVPDDRIAVALQAADVQAFRAVAPKRTGPLTVIGVG